MEWRLIQKYFAENTNHITRHHITSIDEFIKTRLPATIKHINPLKVVKPKHTIEVYIGGEDASRISIARPVLKTESGITPLYPNDARVKDMYYCSDVYADILVRYTGGVNKTFPAVRIGTIPIMVNSCLCVLEGQPPEVKTEMGSCVFDQGGYFIIDGLEKCLIGQERLVNNRAFITIPSDPQLALQALIETTSEDDPFPKSVMLFLHKKTNLIFVRIPQVGIDSPLEVPLFTVFRALGVESDRYILQFILGDLDDPINKDLADFLFYTVLNNDGIYTTTDAHAFLANHVRYKSTDHVLHILVNDFLRNAGPNFRDKCITLGILVKDFVKTHLGYLKLGDKDNFRHKRIDTSGELVFGIFRDYYNKFRADVRRQIEYAYTSGPWSTMEDISDMIRENELGRFFDYRIIDQGFRTSLKGKWGIDMKDGIIQDLNRISYLSYMTHMRSINNPMDRDRKLAQPRRLDCSQWGIACPTQSPDGQNLGLTKNMAILATVTTNSSPETMRTILRELGCTPMRDVGLNHNMTMVFLNDNIYGIVEEPDVFVDKFRALRRSGGMDVFASINWNRIQQKISVFCDAGRLTRPLLIVQGGKLVLKEEDLENPWDALFTMGMEYVDVEEANNALIAMTPAEIGEYTTHCEIHPSTALSLYTNSIPFAHHNQAPRNVLSCAQGKQAIGVYATNFNNRMDTMSYLLNYPQRPLVSTKYTQYCNIDKLPNGENLIVAIACYSGYNIEDSVIINKQSFERGMFNVTYLKSFADVEEEGTFFANPHDLKNKSVNISTKFCNELTIDENGFPKTNAFVEDQDALLGKVSVSNQDKAVVYADVSKIADKTIEGIVDKVLVFRNASGERSVKVRLRQTRLPQLGDKVASRHAQKGVVGMILNEEDMPFTAAGVRPDIIINPHALPTRMTIAQLLECVCAKAAALNCHLYDATTFERHDINKCCEDLSQAGYERYCNEVLYDGRSGAQIACDIVISPTYYLRLKHMVADKENWRSEGAVSTLTRQPVRGRAVNGGLRVGEMERDAIAAHGTISFLKEAFIDKSDKYMYRYGENATLEVPYSFKLLLQELEALNISAKMSI